MSETKLESGENIKNELQKLKGNFNQDIQNFMSQKVADFKKNNTIKITQQFKHGLNMFFKLFNLLKFKKRFDFLTNLLNPSIYHYYKQKGKKMEDSNITNLEYLLAVEKIKKIKNNNLIYYRSLQNNTPNFDIPFIYCALHFQPEKSSSPWGGHFVNQYLIIDMLSKALPHGWKIYVKDHIAQYTSPATGEPFRDKTFYDDIRKLHNVEIIPMEYSSFDLIEKAQAVASIAGSVLWEAVLRGKPALAFGVGHHCWCGGCEGVFYTPDTESLKEALNKIQSGYKVNHQKIILYSNLVEKLAYKGYVGGSSQALNSGITPLENAKIQARAIKDFIGQPDL